MILDNDKIDVAQSWLCVDDFYKPAHGEIYKSIVALWETGQPVDTVTLMGWLDSKGVLEKVGGAVYLSILIENTPTPSNAETYARRVLDASQLRKIIRTCGEISADAYSRQLGPEAIVAVADQRINDICASRQSSGVVTLKEGSKRVYEILQKRYDNRGKTLGVPSGFPDLDHLTHGFQTGDLIIVGARPSMGKTAFVLDIIKNCCIARAEDKIETAIFSLEMGSESLVQRLLSSHARVDSNALKDGFISEGEWDRIASTMETFTKAPLTIIDDPTITVPELRAKAKRIQKETGLRLLVVDYLQLMNTPKKYSSSRVQDVSELSRGLKMIANELKVPVIAISQLSRAVEQRQNKLPQLADLRESGALEQDADIVLFLYRESYYAYENEKEKRGVADDNTPDPTDIRIAKHRNGSMGDIKLGWIGRYTTFVNLEK